MEVGDDFDDRGLYIDEVSLYLIEPENQTNATNGTINQTNANTTNGTINQTNANTTNGTINQTNANTTNGTINQTVHKDHQLEDNNTIFDILSIILALPLNQLPSLKYSAFFA